MIIRFQSVLVLSCICVCSPVFSYIVNTTCGNIEGYLNHEKIIAFHEIPYAKPPIGKYRWKLPRPVEPWNNTLQAKKNRSIACYQQVTTTRKGLNMSENCLVLNIYTPDLSGEKKAVLFFIHGGGFNKGTSHEYDGSLLAKKDIVVVTTNYRLGILGFFDSDGDNKWENYGLWDLKLALRWVNDNIEGFGGDPQRITIAGGSAGGSLTSEIATSPEFHGLFTRVISQSGTAISPKLYRRNPSQVYKGVLMSTNCTSRKCLYKTSATRLVRVANNLEYKGYDFPVSYTFAPFVDGEVIPVDPFEVFKALSPGKNIKDEEREKIIKIFQSYDHICGYNTGEGTLILSHLESLASERGFTIQQGIDNTILDLYLEEYLHEYFPQRKLELKKKLFSMYFSKVRSTQLPSGDLANALNSLHTDFLMAAPCVNLLNYHSKGMRTSYLYNFGYTFEFRKAGNPPWFTEAPHTDERAFVFGDFPAFYNRSNYKFTKEEHDLRNRMMSSWTSFIKTGNPNENSSDGPWRRYDTQTQFSMVFGPVRNISNHITNVNKLISLYESNEKADIIG